MEVQNVNDSEFKDALKNNENVVVKYYAGWCGSCRLIAPKFKKLAAENNVGTIFLEVDAENNQEARSLAKVNNLPFFATFKNGELAEGFPTSKIEAVVEMIEKL